ncbi:kidney mitochondrial carrier protein 1-like [Tubulanus polymorphus]|uniref:kidney mitochondrial carrier protein 1-like n=1 Tax=Tubulanus polymorphus TaxID=672921 RepID=UPI003DA50B4B
MKKKGPKNWKDWRPFVFGGFASCVAEFATFPIDLTKTRLQLQGQTTGVTSVVRYRGMFHALLRISCDEGVRSLYSGLPPAILRQATYGTVKIGIYHMLKRCLIHDPDGPTPPHQYYIREETLATDVLCGIIAGSVSSALANPTDVLKVRMQAKNEKFRNVKMFKAFKMVYENEGIRGLWTGVGPTSQRAAIVVGVELPAYDVTKRHLINDLCMIDNEICHFTASFIAGLAGAIMSNPIDVVKSRMMNQQRVTMAPQQTATGTAAGNVYYTGTINCFAQMIKREGFMSLYKGFIPTWVRLGPWNIVFFMTYEQIKNII